MMLGEFDLSLDLFSAVSAVHQAEIGFFYFCFSKDGLQYKILVGVEVSKVRYLYFHAFFFSIQFSRFVGENDNEFSSSVNL